jgi:integrase/recombinase XerD
VGHPQWLLRQRPNGGTCGAPRTAPTDSHPAWTAGDVQAFSNHWPLGTRKRLAMELLQWSGPRITDAAMLGPQHVGKDGVIAYTQKKTGSMAYCPWRCVLPAYAATLSAVQRVQSALKKARTTSENTVLHSSHMLAQRLTRLAHGQGMKHCVRLSTTPNPSTTALR